MCVCARARAPAHQPLAGRGWAGEECRNHLELLKCRGFSASGAESCGLEGVWGLGRGAGRQGLDGLSTARTVWPRWGGWEGLVFTVRHSKPCLHFLGACRAPHTLCSAPVHATGLGTQAHPLSPSPTQDPLQPLRCRCKCPKGRGENTGEVGAMGVGNRECRGPWPAGASGPADCFLAA